MSKKCSVAECENKHHGRGYCKNHYRQIVLPELVKDRVCSVAGCTKSVRSGQTCVMHLSRLKRHGNTEDRVRARDMFSVAEKLSECENPYEFEIPSRNSWAHIAKIIYGNKCMRCGWDRGNCDVHHKIYHRNGGKNTLHNSEVICPNCHRLEHQREDNYYSEETKEVIRMAIQNHNI